MLPKLTYSSCVITICSKVCKRRCFFLLKSQIFVLVYNLYFAFFNIYRHNNIKTCDSPTIPSVSAISCAIIVMSFPLSSCTRNTQKLNCVFIFLKTFLLTINYIWPTFHLCTIIGLCVFIWESWLL